MFKSSPRKIENYDINSLNVAFVVDRFDKHSVERLKMGPQYDKLIATAEDPQGLISRSGNGWIWNVATVIGTEFQRASKVENGKFEFSELNYRMCFFHASAKDMKHVNNIIDNAQNPSFIEQVQNSLATSVNFSRNRKQKNAKAVITAENYLLSKAALLGCAVVSEENDNSYISSNVGLLSFTVPTRRPQEYLL